MALCFYNNKMHNTLPKDKVYWYTKKQPKIEKLGQDLKADIAIIGGGMTGLSAAQAFIKKGFKVVLLEKDFCGAGASGKSSGFITPDSEFGLSEFINRFGKEGAKKLWDFGNFGVEFIRNNIIKNRIKCDYIAQDAFFAANKKAHIGLIKEEYKARKELGYKVKIYSNENFQEVLGTKEYYAGVRYYDTFVMNSYLYCQGMKDALKPQIRLFENTGVKKIKNNMLETFKGHKINTNKILVCADRFIPDLKPKDRDFYHVQTYLLVSAPLSRSEMEKIFPEKQMMVWDSDLSYKYFRPIGGNRLLIGGGNIISLYYWNEIHNYSGMFNSLDSYFRKKFPGVNARWEYMWPGMIGISKDFLPIVTQDKNMPNVYYAGAAAGLPWCAAIGNYLSDIIIRNSSEYDKYLSPSRKFPPVSMLQPILRKMATFALSHGYVEFVE